MESFRERRERLDAEQAEMKEYAEKLMRLKKLVRADLTNSGYLSVKYKLEHIKNNRGSLPFEGLSEPAIIQCFEEAMERFLELQKDKT